MDTKTRNERTRLRDLLVPALAAHFQPDMGLVARVDGTRRELTLRPSGESFSGVSGPLEAVATTCSTEDRSGRLVIELANVGTRRISVEILSALKLTFDFDPRRDLPRTRHLRGSWHYDACYPPRAFVVEEHLHASADHSKRVGIGGINASVYSPSLQLAIGDDFLHSVQIGLEWSGSWEISAGWSEPTYRGEPTPVFTVACTFGVGQLSLEPGAGVVLPTIHVCSGSARYWSEIDDHWRGYVRERVAPRPVGPSRSPVSYDHWFGINEHFDLPLLLRQASRAAEVGCEYFCLDAAWYASESFDDGLGNWTSPDPKRFPNGFADLMVLSEKVRSLGMGFGLWQAVQLGRPGTELPSVAPELYRPAAPSSMRQELLARYGSGDSHRKTSTINGLLLALESDGGVELATSTLRRLVSELSLSWMRFETVAEDGLRYNQGLYRLFENLRRIQPEIYIEACSGGGQSLDLGMVARANGAWLSDHTTVPSVTRYCQTGALRWLPPDYLNMAVTSRDGSPRQHLHPGRLLSRMVGTLSFNGDIAAWSPAEATAVRSWVDVFKQIRDQRGPRVRFPLGQPRSVEDWDAAAFLGGESGDLLYVFRDLGPARREIASLGQDDFSVGGDWELVLADEGVTIDQRAGKCTLELPQWGGALLRRS